MKVTLHLYLSPSNNGTCVIAERVWADITSGNNPFWNEIYRSLPAGGHFGFPNYPHTGDKHTFFLPRSGYRIVFTATTETGGVTKILGTVVSITKKDEPHTPIILGRDELVALMKDEGWNIL